MSVRPVGFHADGRVRVWHDEGDHGGVVAFAAITFGVNRDGTANPDFLLVPCPVSGCGAVSLHPVSGGADPVRVQLLFARTIRRRAAALGIPASGRSWTAIKARIKTRVETMDGPGHFLLDALQSEDDAATDT